MDYIYYGFSPTVFPENTVKRNWIVIASDQKSGALLPSHRPYQHYTREEADKEAERLARKNPNNRFYVYEMVSAMQTENPPVTKFNIA